jgi:hypothetical protein
MGMDGGRSGPRRPLSTSSTPRGSFSAGRGAPPQPTHPPTLTSPRPVWSLTLVSHGLSSTDSRRRRAQGPGPAGSIAAARRCTAARVVRMEGCRPALAAPEPVTGRSGRVFSTGAILIASSTLCFVQCTGCVRVGHGPNRASWPGLARPGPAVRISSASRPVLRPRVHDDRRRRRRRRRRPAEHRTRRPRCLVL